MTENEWRCFQRGEPAVARVGIGGRRQQEVDAAKGIVTINSLLKIQTNKLIKRPTIFGNLKKSRYTTQYECIKLIVPVLGYNFDRQRHSFIMTDAIKSQGHFLAIC